MFTPYMAFASLSYLFMILGLLNRKKNRRLHIRFMSLAMLIDISIVCILEIQRNAIQTAIDMKLGFFQQLHIGSSLSAVVLYFPTAYLGWKTYKRREAFHSHSHRYFGMIVFILRSIGFLTMFFFLKKESG